MSGRASDVGLTRTIIETPCSEGSDVVQVGNLWIGDVGIGIIRAEGKRG